METTLTPFARQRARGVIVLGTNKLVPLMVINVTTNDKVIWVKSSPITLNLESSSSQTKPCLIFFFTASHEKALRI